MNSDTGSDSGEDEDIDDSRTDSGDISDLGWLSQQGLQMATVPDVYLPTFARPVASMLRAILGEGKDKAGYPDSLLLWQAIIGHGGGRMAAEVKAFWSFHDRYMAQLLSGYTAAPETGEVRYHNEGLGLVSELHNILLQVSH